MWLGVGTLVGLDSVDFRETRIAAIQPKTIFVTSDKWAYSITGMRHGIDPLVWITGASSFSEPCG